MPALPPEFYAQWRAKVRPGWAFAEATATPPELREKMKQIFLHMHEDAAGRVILAEIAIERFVEVDDHIYDSARNTGK